MQNLPINELLPSIVSTLLRERRLVLQAPPGTGKSTRVPPALLGAVDPRSQILVAEPRRIAARLLANRVASELDQRVGELVGYRVRFEDMCGPDTRLVYLTSGVLLRRLISDPNLSGIGCVIIDEFHERHLDTDMVLALALRAQRTVRRDLLVVVMSATLQGEQLQRAIGDCPFIQSEEPIRPISIGYAPQEDDRPVAKQVASAVRTLLSSIPSGDLLVFLPGAAEIRRSQESLQPLVAQYGLEILPLHGDMPLREQATALQQSDRRRAVLCTNVAESSITVPGIVGVVDSGLCHTAMCSPWSGLPSIELQKISRASAIQRAGRAGRVSDGHVLRLYTKGDFQSRKEFDTPEILRMDLCEAVLMAFGLGIRDIASLNWVDAPPPAQLRAAEDLLRSLGATSVSGELTPLGRQMLRFPVHPRLSKLALESHRRGAGDDGCLAAALLSERDLRLESRASFSGHARNVDVRTGDSDLDELFEAFETAESRGFRPDRCRHEGIDAGAARSVAEARRQLQRCLHQSSERGKSAIEGGNSENALNLAVLSAYPDRVAWRREAGRRDLVMSNGVVAELSDLSVVREGSYLVALVADERVSRTRRGVPTIRLACRIDPNWLLELYSNGITTEEQYLWIQPPGRVENVCTIRYGVVVLDESRAVAKPGPETAEVLMSVAESRGLLKSEPVNAVRQRLSHLVACGLVSENEQLTDSSVREHLQQLCLNKVALDDVDAAALAEHILATLPLSSATKLRVMAPARYMLPGGRSVEVHYESDRDPWIESRLQDFFGMTSTPKICDGRRSLTVHLLAPNQRAVQVTQDLDGFWDKHYPAIRRELMRRYPRHFWPEDGRHAAPVRSNRK